MRLSIFFSFIVILMILISERVESQEIEATVTVNMEQLSFDARTDVSSMQSDVERYVNNESFLKSDWEGPKIPVDITIVLSGGSNRMYKARLLVMSRRFLDGPTQDAGQTTTSKLYEQDWGFEYGMGKSMTYNPLRFDEFNTMIDYYMLLVIGFDLDTYSELGGNEAFAKAKSLVQLGASNNADGYETYSQPGEFTKYNLVNELNDMRYYGLRELFFAYYVDGLDQMAFNKEQAMLEIKDIIANMAYFKEKKLVGPSVLMQAFFDNKAQEIATIFNGDDDPILWKNLTYLDPGNTTLYFEARDGKLRSYE